RARFILGVGGGGRGHRRAARGAEPGRSRVARASGARDLGASLAHPAPGADQQHAGARGRCRRRHARRGRRARVADRHVSLPWMPRAAFREQGAATLETARSLGRSQMRAFVAVTLPLARPSLVAGVSLAMMEALADFGTVATFGYRTLTEAVYRVWYGMFDRAAAAQLASLLLLFALCLLALERSLRGRARFTQSQRRGQGIEPVPLRGWRAGLATAVCACTLGLAFVVPVAQL